MISSTHEPTAFAQTWGVFGHKWAVEHLRKSIFYRRVRHAYLIVGAEGVGKMTLARAFAMALNCTFPDEAGRPCGECPSCRRIVSGNHPDLVYSQTDPNTGALKIEAIREAASKLSLKPFEARVRIAIFDHFDHAQPRAQDALLKTLEEPPPHAVLMVLASSIEPILPTITSRSQTLHLRPAPVETVEAALHTRGAEGDQAHLLAHLSGGRVGWALNALADPSLLEAREGGLNLLDQLIEMNRAARFKLADDLAKDKGALIPLLELWLTYWRDLLLVTSESGLDPANIDRLPQLRALANRLTRDDAVRALMATQTLLETLLTNANVRLALDVLLLDYPSIHSPIS